MEWFAFWVVGLMLVGISHSVYELVHYGRCELSQAEIKFQEPRNFTVYTQEDVETYIGFDRRFLIDGEPADHIALVVAEGEVEMFAVSHPEHLAGLELYLREHGHASARVIGVYKRLRMTV